MTSILLCGCCGKMGAAVQRAVAGREDCQIVAGVDPAPSGSCAFPVYNSVEQVTEDVQVIVDFSHPSCLSPISPPTAAATPAWPPCCATTGYSEEQTREIQEASKALPPVLLQEHVPGGGTCSSSWRKRRRPCWETASTWRSWRCTTTRRSTPPSGTALMIADAINEVRDNEMRYTYDRHAQRKKREKREIGLHSVRGRHHRGGTPGDLRRTERGPHPLPFPPSPKSSSPPGRSTPPCS